MIPEIGFLALIIGFVLSIFMSFVPLIGVKYKNILWMRSGAIAAHSQFLFLLISYLDEMHLVVLISSC